ncbi:hypothetical protein QR680_013039 [Steinernema hermaphroditum]|uniref:Uncharacterized protein n=1 Tax=Steinernema hermaphroditum TaxID=289476 RepID=A0AA39I464_9BILA|nr:hypothetical protein QR680_013039 [Steinernema hermaphroditum]
MPHETVVEDVGAESAEGAELDGLKVGRHIGEEGLEDGGAECGDVDALEDEREGSEAGGDGEVASEEAEEIVGQGDVLRGRSSLEARREPAYLEDDALDLEVAEGELEGEGVGRAELLGA